MEDLFARMQELLSSEEGRKQVSELAGALGASNPLFGGASESEKPPASSPQEPSIPALSPELIFLLQKLFSSSQEENEDTKLLMALRPHLSEKRQQRIDRAIQLMKLTALLPLLRESGLLERWFPHA